MKTFSLKYKIIAFLLVLAFTFQSLNSFNWHMYGTGISTFHEDRIEGIIPCFGHSYHTIYKCGKTLHLY